MSGDGLPGPTDSWVTLAGLARETTSIRLGTMVTSATFRYPGPLAISVAQVDEMSGGRVELGLGAGWFEAEHKAYAIPFPPLGERFERLREQLDIVTGLWTTPVGETFDYTGKHQSIADSPALPKPVQTPHPPIIIGGGGPKRTPALAATFAAEFNAPFMSLDDLTATYDRVRTAVEDGGPRAGLADVFGGVRGVCGTRRRADCRPCGGDRPRGRRTPRQFAVGRHPERDRRQARPRSPRPACSGSTCSFWIWPTSITSTCSPPRSYLDSASRRYRRSAD